MQLVTCTENFVKFGRVAFEICDRTDGQKQTNRETCTKIAILRSPSGAN